MPNAVDAPNAAQVLPTAPMSLILDLLESLQGGARPYADVIDAWQTSCPRLTVWEDSVDGGYVCREPGPDGGIVVALTANGHEALRSAGRAR